MMNTKITIAVLESFMDERGATTKAMENHPILKDKMAEARKILYSLTQLPLNSRGDTPIWYTERGPKSVYVITDAGVEYYKSLKEQ